MLGRNVASPSVTGLSCSHSFPHSDGDDSWHRQQGAAPVSGEWRRSGRLEGFPTPSAVE